MWVFPYLEELNFSREEIVEGLNEIKNTFR
ncbi:DUF6483 family protein [Clostridium perfringens]|nr:DUF6483 family protein [Clostridium perfringens]MDM1007719.1 DUF6483 family protein [Clostridium perfringens]